MPSSQQSVSAKFSRHVIPRESQQASGILDLSKRSVQMQIFDATTPMLTTLRGLLLIVALHGNPVALGDGRSAFHLSPMPSESEPVYVETAPEAQLDSSRVWLCKDAFQGLSPKKKKRSCCDLLSAARVLRHFWCACDVQDDMEWKAVRCLCQGHIKCCTTR